MNSLLSSQDAAYWAAVFAHRSYFNLTHVKEDTMQTLTLAKRATVTTFREAQQRAVESYEALVDFASEKKEKLVVATSPFLEKTQAITRAAIEKAEYLGANARAQYDRALKGHVDKLIDQARPHYDEHVSPLVDKAAFLYWESRDNIVAAVVETRASVANALATAFAELVAQIRETCPLGLEAAKGIQEMTGISLIDGAHNFCRKPEDAASSIMKTMGILLALLFRRPLWRLLWGTVFLALRILWLFFPLRFLFRRSEKVSKVHPTNGTAAKREKSTKARKAHH
jgi:hypothetical protein